MQTAHTILEAKPRQLIFVDVIDERHVRSRDDIAVQFSSNGNRIRRVVKLGTMNVCGLGDIKKVCLPTLVSTPFLKFA